MKVTVTTRNKVRTTLDPAQVEKQVLYVTPKETWVSVTLLDGRNLQLRTPVPGIECPEAPLKTTVSDKKTFLEKLG